MRQQTMPTRPIYPPTTGTFMYLFIYLLSYFIYPQSINSLSVLLITIATRSDLPIHLPTYLPKEVDKLHLKLNLT